MSPNIIQLSPDLVTRIAAGEVVERPASVLKECIENSLDAGATTINIYLEGAGRSLLSIQDNGCGMSKEEAKLSLKRHATSKIKNLSDLESLSTFGFRGEALPSIASVSRLRLTTRRPEDETGWEIRMEGGSVRSEKPVAREPGTTIEVRDLFFNTPARFKFLKADSTERSQCFRIIEEMAFSALPVRFHFSVEKNSPLIFSKNVLRDRVGDVWGHRFKSGMNEIQSQTPHFHLTGVVTDVRHHQATSRHQFLFVNKRPVTNRRLSRAVYNAYTGALPTMRHPAFVLFLNVDPKTVDVNVHPSKREVKLTHEGELFGFIQSAVKTAIQDESLPMTAAPTKSAFASPLPSAVRVQESLQTLYAPTPPREKPVSAVPPPLMEPSFKKAKMTALAQVNRMFVVAESDDSLFILDQHAAAERVVYEKLFSYLTRGTAPSQMLLVPFQWEVARSLFAAVESRCGVMRKMGFLIEPFGGETFLIKGYPAVLGEKVDLNSVLDGLSDLLAEESPRILKTENFHHKLAALTACKSSVKAGDALDIKECQALLNQIVECDAPLTCPHGRPTFIQYPFPDLERKFGR